MSRPMKGAQACSVCHQRKIKCDLGQVGDAQPCSNCRLGAHSCRPHQRKRRHYSPGPSPTSAPAQRPAGTLSDRWRSQTALPTPIHDQQRQQQQQQATTHVGPAGSAVTGQGYLGRCDYVGGEVLFSEDCTAASAMASPVPEPSDVDMTYINQLHAFDLPSRSIRESLIDAFMERCHPWMPIVERRWLCEHNNQARPSYLLLQAVFLAGSRVSSRAMATSLSHDFYERAKALFYHGNEQNPLILVVAACLLQWWNPTGPETVSTSTSGFWIRIAVAMAYQIGLHLDRVRGPSRALCRRLWWTLVSRDNVISVALGRPRTINLNDSDVSLPSTDDFASPDAQATIFVAYVRVCNHMGDIAEAQRRRALSDTHQTAFATALLQWINHVPPQLRLFQGNATKSLTPYNCHARQLVVPYFVSLIMLHRTSNPRDAQSTASMFSSSYLVGIFEDFISRDQLHFLGPAFAFYALAAGLCQLCAYRYTALREIAGKEIRIVRTALDGLARRWGSAKGALRALDKTKHAIEHQSPLEGLPTRLTPEMDLFFRDLGPDLCRLWILRDLPAPDQDFQVGETTIVAFDHTVPLEPQTSASHPSADDTLQFPEMTFDLLTNPSYNGGGNIPELLDNFDDPIGSWLLDGFDWRYCQ